MIIDLKHVFVNENAFIPIEYSLDLSSFEYGGIYPLKKPVTVSGRVFNKASIVSLEADIKYFYEAPCDRCGVLSVKENNIHLSRTIVSSLENEENDDIVLVPDMKLDLDELIYSEVIVNMPMKHLCREDCKGLCPKCGKNLNETECGCPKKEIDPRLSALADLLKD